MTDNFTHDGPYYLGIDLGGTNMRAGVVSEAGRSLSFETRRTEASRGPERGIENLIAVAEQAVQRSGLGWDAIRGIGLATPGTMDIPTGVMIRPHNLPGWTDIPIRQIIADRLHKPTILQNDANAAAYGEYWMGAARHAHSLVFWTLGTGVGSGIIIDDVIVEGEHSTGSECGHIIIEMDGGRLCRSGQHGTLEAYASATALVERCREELDAGRETVLREWLDHGETLTPLLMAQAVDHGDALADEIIMEAARCLGVGTVTLMHALDPAMVLIGGAMTFGRNETELGRRFLERIRQEIRARAFPIPAAKTIVDYATLGGQAGYIGAAGCIRRALHRGPVSLA